MRGFRAQGPGTWVRGGMWAKQDWLGTGSRERAGAEGLPSRKLIKPFPGSEQVPSCQASPADAPSHTRWPRCVLSTQVSCEILVLPICRPVAAAGEPPECPPHPLLSWPPGGTVPSRGRCVEGCRAPTRRERGWASSHRCAARHTVRGLTSPSDRGVCHRRDGSAVLTAGPAGARQAPFITEAAGAPGLVDRNGLRSPAPPPPRAGQPGRCCRVAGCREKLGGTEGLAAMWGQAARPPGAPDRRHDQGNIAGTVQNWDKRPRRKKCVRRAPGRLSQVSAGLLLPAQVMIPRSRDQASSRALH